MRQFLNDVCLGSAEILLDFYSKKQIRSKEKIDAGFVTEADIRSETYIIEAINKAYPNSSILAEESGCKRDTQAIYKWIIDPLDGTTNFAKGIPFFAVSIAVETDGSLTHAAIYNPVSKEFFYAERGNGSYLNEQRNIVSNEKDISKAVLSTGDYYDRGNRFDDSMKLFEKTYRISRVVRVTGSVALSLAYVAAGKFDGFFHYDPNYWDIAAGSLMVEEAGGLIRSTSGKLLIATNNRLDIEI